MEEGESNILMNETIGEVIQKKQLSGRRAVSLSIISGCSAPVMVSALTYVDTMRRDKVPQNLIIVSEDEIVFIYRLSAISMLLLLLKEQIWLVECRIIADGQKIIIKSLIICYTYFLFFYYYLTNMFNNTPTNNPRGNKNKKMIPCKYFAMGTCNKGNDCPYEIDFIF